MNIFCGVPAWKEYLTPGDDDTAILHFGGIAKGEEENEFWKKYNIKTNDGDGEVDDNPFYTSQQFYTYDPTPGGKNTFEWPFGKHGDGKGTLSNWWAGCEDITHTIYRLLNGGWCAPKTGDAGNPFGYVFRKNVPRLVFVYSNEFDNEMSRTYDKYSGSKESWKKYIPDITKDKKGCLVQSGETKSDVLDPYCLDVLRDADRSALNDFLVNIDVNDSGTTGMLDSAAEIRRILFEDGGNGKRTWDHTVTTLKPRSLPNDSKLSSKIAATQSMDGWYGLSTSQFVRQVFGLSQWNGLGKGAFPGYVYESDGKSKKMHYNGANTLGFHALRQYLATAQ